MIRAVSVSNAASGMSQQSIGSVAHVVWTTQIKSLSKKANGNGNINRKEVVMNRKTDIFSIWFHILMLATVTFWHQFRRS